MTAARASLHRSFCTPSLERVYCCAVMILCSQYGPTSQRLIGNLVPAMIAMLTLPGQLAGGFSSLALAAASASAGAAAGAATSGRW